MKNKLKLLIGSLVIALFFIGYACKEDEYSMGDLVAPSDIEIITEIEGQNATNPSGDGSGIVYITPKAKNVSTFKIGFSQVNNPNSTPSFVNLNGATYKQKFTNPGEVTYRITVVAYGAGGLQSTATKDITVLSIYDVDPQIVTFLTGNSSKTWKVDKETSGHFGVGPWNKGGDDGWLSPVWWSAGPNEKEECCNCFYTARFTFKKLGNDYSLDVSAPDGVYAKTGGLAGVDGLPATGDEGCYTFGSGQASSTITFASASSGVPAGTPSTQASIILGDRKTYIGYGALQKEYEILVINEDYMYLRVQGTEIDNAWYLKLIPAQ